MRSNKKLYFIQLPFFNTVSQFQTWCRGKIHDIAFTRHFRKTLQCFILTERIRIGFIQNQHIEKLMVTKQLMRRTNNQMTIDFSSMSFAHCPHHQLWEYDLQTLM